MNFHEKLVSLRKSMGLSQEELGAEIDVGTAKKFIKWYLMIAGTAGILALAAMAYFAFHAVYVW